MKAYRNIRLGKGYCCEWDDGPYSKWKKKNRRAKKRSNKQADQKEIKSELQGTSRRGKKAIR